MTKPSDTLTDWCNTLQRIADEARDMAVYENPEVTVLETKAISEIPDQCITLKYRIAEIIENMKTPSH